MGRKGLRVWTKEELKVAASAMQESKAWPAVFRDGAALVLAKAADDAVTRFRAKIDRQRRVREIARDYEP